MAVDTDLMGVDELESATEQWFNRCRFIFDLELVNEETDNTDTNDIDVVCQHMQKSGKDLDTQLYVSSIKTWKKLKANFAEARQNIVDFQNGEN